MTTCRRTIKFSEFDEVALDEAVGLGGGNNARAPASSGGGVTKLINQVGHGLDRGDWVRFDGSIYLHAQATTAILGEVIGVVAQVVDADNFILQQAGYIEDVSAQTGPEHAYIPMTPGQVYFLSETIAGEVDTTEPTDNNTVSAPCIIATTTTGGWIYTLKRGLINGNGGTTGSGGSDGCCAKVTITQPGHGFAVGDWIYVSANNTFTKAIATSLTPALAVGMVVETPVDGDADKFIVQTNGYTDVLSGLAAAPNYYFLSDTVAGTMTTTEPTNPGYYSKPVFINLNAGAGFILEQRVKRVVEGPGVLLVNQPGHGLAVGDYVRVSVGNTYTKAQADSLANADGVGFVVFVSGDDFMVQQTGYTTVISSPSANSRYYLDASTAGAKTTVEPTAIGQVSKPIFFSTTTSAGWIADQRPLVQPFGGGGGWTQVFNYSVSGDTQIDMDNLLTGVNVACIIIENLTPGAGPCPVGIQLGFGATPTYSGANYTYTNIQNLGTGGFVFGLNRINPVTTAYMDIVPWDAGGQSIYGGLSGIVFLYGLSDTGPYDKKRLTWSTNTLGGIGYEKMSSSGGLWNQPTTAVTSVRVMTPIGNFGSGRIGLWIIS